MQLKAKDLENQKIALDEKVISTKRSQLQLNERYKEIIAQVQYQQQDIQQNEHDQTQQKQSITVQQKSIQTAQTKHQNSLQSIQVTQKSLIEVRRDSSDCETQLKQTQQKLITVKQTIQASSKEHHFLVERLVAEIDELKQQIHTTTQTVSEQNAHTMKLYTQKISQKLLSAGLPPTSGKALQQHMSQHKPSFKGEPNHQASNNPQVTSFDQKTDRRTFQMDVPTHVAEGSVLRLHFFNRRNLCKERKHGSKNS